MKQTSILFILASGLLLSACQNSGQLGTGRDETNQIEVTSTYPYELQTKLTEPSATPETNTQTAIVEQELIKPNKNKLSSNSTTNNATVDPSISTETTNPELVQPKTTKNTKISPWQPNEGQLIRGNELISGLERDIKRKPTPAEMSQQVQTHMGLNGKQAEILISALQ